MWQKGVKNVDNFLRLMAVEIQVIGDVSPQTGLVETLPALVGHIEALIVLSLFLLRT